MKLLELPVYYHAYQNMTSNASVAMVPLIMFRFGIISNVITCSIKLHGAINISAVIVS